MPGIDLSLDLPVLGDQFSVILSKLVTAIEAIEADLAPRVTAGELEIDSELSMGGAPLTNVGGVRLDGGETSVVGSLYMKGNELYVVTAAGVIQLTASGTINIAAAGTIGGDFGGVNPASVIFEDGLSLYSFYDSPGVYASIAADNVILHSASGSLTLSCDNTISTGRQFNFKDLPAAGASGLVFNATGSVLSNAETTRITNAFKLTTLDVSSTSTLTGNVTAVANVSVGGDLAVTGDVKRGVTTFTLPVHNGDAFINTIGGDFVENYVNVGKSTTGAAVVWLQHIPVEVGDRIKSLSVTLQKVSNSVVTQSTLSLIKLAGGNVTTTVGGTSTSSTGLPLGVQTVTHTVNSPVVVAADELFFLQYDFPVNSAAAYISRPVVTKDHP